MKLSIIIVSYNTKELLRRCVSSIEKSQDDLEKEVFIVDNASTDGSDKLVEQGYKDIKILRNKENLGFAKANNQALRQVYGEYCLLLNSDTEVKPDALSNLVEFAENNPQAGIVGAKLLNPDASIQSSIYHLPTLWRAIKEFWLGKKGEYEKYALTASDAVGVEAVTFAAVLIPKKTIERIGFLEERYFMYFEDLDYCRRVRQADLEVYYLPTAEVVHFHGASGKSNPKAYQYLVESSKIYNGIIKYWLLTAIIWLGQKWQKILKKKN